MHHQPADRGEIVDHFERVELIGDVFGRAEIGHELILADMRRRRRIEVEIERDAARTSVEIHRGIIETEPRPEIAGSRRVLGEMLEIAVNDMAWFGSRQRTGPGYLKNLADLVDAPLGLKEIVGKLLRADFHYRLRGREMAFGVQANEHIEGV